MMKRESQRGVHRACAPLSATPQRSLVAAVATLLLVPLALAGCDDASKKKEPEPNSAAVAKPALSVAEKPAPVAAPAAPAEVKASRPAKIDFELTDERRAEIEKAYPEAKGFLVATTIEEKLKAKKVTSEEPALKAFDSMVKGKWLLASGTMVNLTDTGFDLGVTYTPQLPGDPMGMSRQWFPITFSDVKGYAKGKFKLGDSAVVLAKYTGAKKAAQGYELVDQQHWK